MAVLAFHHARDDPRETPVDGYAVQQQLAALDLPLDPVEAVFQRVVRRGVGPFRAPDELARPLEQPGARGLYYALWISHAVSPATAATPTTPAMMERVTFPAFTMTIWEPVWSPHLQRERNR